MKAKINELKKIDWVKPKDLVTHFITVIIFTVLMTALIYLIDLGMASIIPFFLK